MSDALRFFGCLALSGLVVAALASLILTGRPAAETLARADEDHPHGQRAEKRTDNSTEKLAEKPLRQLLAVETSPQDASKIRFPFEVKMNPWHDVEFDHWPRGWDLIVARDKVKVVHLQAHAQLGVDLPRISVFPQGGWPPYHAPSAKALSPDGEFLVLGYGFQERRNRQELPTDVGEIFAYHLPTGKRLSVHVGRLGSVSELKFTKDGKTLCVFASRFSMDGP